MGVAVENPRKSGLLSGNGLKIIAAVSMLIDHVGVLFFPDMELLRIIGRLAFPVFAYMIAEGCRYTGSRLRYFGLIFLLASLCQVVYYIFDGSTFMCILVTFSLSILIIYALQDFKEAITENRGLGICMLRLAVLVVTIGAVYCLHQRVRIDYGFRGTLVPVFAAVFMPRGKGSKPDSKLVHILMLGIGLLILARWMGGVQIWSLAALPVLLLYSGQRGKWKMKYFFYIFYPVHLAALQGLQMLLSYLK